MPTVKKCRQCKSPFSPWSTTQVVCSPKCALEYNKAQEEKKAARQKKSNREAVRKLNRGNLKWQHKHTQASFNKLRRLQEFKWFKDRDLEPECISCGGKNKTWTCGHFITVGGNGDLRYDPKNTFLQCWWNCNQNKSGNIQGTATERGFKRGLIERFGEQEGQAIIDYCESYHEQKNYTCDQLEEMRTDFNRQIRELEKELEAP